MLDDEQQQRPRRRRHRRQEQIQQRQSQQQTHSNRRNNNSSNDSGSNDKRIRTSNRTSAAADNDEIDGNGDAVIDCHVKVTHKTGVEMEALTGATVAALTIYDMCKALSHDIVIAEIALVEKTGGKSDYRSSQP